MWCSIRVLGHSWKCLTALDWPVPLCKQGACDYCCDIQVNNEVSFVGEVKALGFGRKVNTVKRNYMMPGHKKSCLCQQGMCGKVMMQNFWLKCLWKLFWVRESLVENGSVSRVPDSYSDMGIVCGFLNNMKNFSSRSCLEPLWLGGMEVLFQSYFHPNKCQIYYLVVNLVVLLFS